MENSLSSSYKAGVYRLIGTLVGALVGVIFIFIQPGNPLLMGIGTLLLIFICNTFHWDRAVPIAGVMFAAIMLSLKNANPFEYSLIRVFNTFVGIAIAVGVNHLIFPPDNLAELRKNLNAVSAKISQAIKDFVCLSKDIDLDSLRSEVIAAIKFLEAYTLEYKPKIESLSDVSTKLECLRSVLSHLKTVDELGPQCCLNPANAEKLRLLKLCDIKTKEFPNSNENLIYNYHVGKILDTLPILIAKLE